MKKLLLSFLLVVAYVVGFSQTWTPVFGYWSYDNLQVNKTFIPPRYSTAARPSASLGYQLIMNIDSGKLQYSNLTSWVTVGSGTTGGGGESSYNQLIQSVGSPVTQRSTFNFGASFNVVDNSVAGRTDITITNNAISNGLLGTMSAHTYKGNNTSSTSTPIDVSVAQLTADLSLFTATAQGLVSPPGTSTGKYLRDDNTWNNPPGTSGAYSGLTDVALSGLTNFDLSRWNNTTSRWNNFSPSITDITSWAGFKPIAPGDTSVFQRKISSTLDGILSNGGRVSADRVSSFAYHSWKLDSVNAFSVGKNNTAGGLGSGNVNTLFGVQLYTSASSYDNFVNGFNDSLKGGVSASAVFGSSNILAASNIGHAVFGNNNVVTPTNPGDFVAGSSNIVGGGANAVFGLSDSATGTYALVAGSNNSGGTFNNVVVAGAANHANMDNQVLFGLWADTSVRKYAIAIGNGTGASARGNAFAVDLAGYAYSVGVANLSGFKFIMPTYAGNDTLVSWHDLRAYIGGGGGGAGTPIGNKGSAYRLADGGSYTIKSLSATFPLKWDTAVTGQINLSLDSSKTSIFRGGIWASIGAAGVPDTFRLGVKPYDYDVHLSGSSLFNTFFDSTRIFLTGPLWATPHNSDTTKKLLVYNPSTKEVEQTYYPALGSAYSLAVGNPITMAKPKAFLVTGPSSTLQGDSTILKWDSAGQAMIWPHAPANSKPIQIYDASGNELFVVGTAGAYTYFNAGNLGTFLKVGNLGVGESQFQNFLSAANGLEVYHFDGSHVPATILARNTQTVDLLQFKDSAGNLYSRFNDRGILVTRVGTANFAQLNMPVSTKKTSMVDGDWTHSSGALTFHDGSIDYNLLAAALENNISTQSGGTYVISTTDYTIVGTGTTSTWTMPTGVLGRRLNLINHGTGAITLSIAVTTANGTTSTSLAAGGSYQVQFDGTVYRKIN